LVAADSLSFGLGFIELALPFFDDAFLFLASLLVRGLEALDLT